MMFKIMVQPFEEALWVQRGKLYETRDEALDDVPAFIDGTDTGPWYAAKVEPAAKWEVKMWKQNPKFFTD